MAKTPQSPKFRYMYYMTKHLRVDMHDRLRVQAALRKTTIEDALNVALSLGLPALESRTAEERAQRKATQEASGAV